MTRQILLFVAGIATCVGISLGIAACAGARRDEPFAPEVVLDDARQVRGEQVFARECAQCHPNGEAGLGPAINDRPLPKGLIAAQIRNGIGAMPAFDDSMISDDDVDAVTEYLVALRRSPKPKPTRQ